MPDLHCGDCLEILPTLDENSIDSCVTDPPYHLTSIVKRFGGNGAAPAKFGTDGAYARASAGFMGKQWDGGNVAFRPETWAAVYRVLKPGAHLLAFGGTRTFHRMACAIEDAGFEIRDTIMWLYGSGFPKSHDVSKAIDKAAGALEHRSKRFNHAGGGVSANSQYKPELRSDHPDFIPYEGRTDAARQWEGWGTALKPACEPIVLARKPLSEKTVAANVLKWGTGAINVDGCRVGEGIPRPSMTGGMGRKASPVYGAFARQEVQDIVTMQGRWPANVIHDGSEEVVGAFPETHARGNKTPTKRNVKTEGWGNIGALGEGEAFAGDSGSAARFFYCAKASKADRNGSKHPTVKPIKLLRYLIRLVTPPGGVVLDPFAGSGTTGRAAELELMRSILIEREPEYQEDIRRRKRSQALSELAAIDAEILT